MKTNAKKNEKTEVVIFNTDLERVIIGLNELSSYEILDFDINFGIARVISELTLIEKSYLKTTKGIMNECLLKDSKGSYVIDDSRNYVGKTNDDREKYVVQINKLHTTENKICWSINASELKKINGLRACTMSKINEFIVDDLK